MSINLDNLALNKATTEVTYGGQSMTITFRPAATTQNRMDAINTDDEIIGFVKEALVAWDIKQGTKKLPLTEKSLRDLPFALVGVIFRAIIAGGSEVDPEA